MKLALIVCATFAACTCLHSQDVDKAKINFDIIRLPLKKLPDSTETYFATIKPVTTSWGNTLGNVYDAEKIVLNGYYRLNDASDADVVIKAELNNELVFDGVTSWYDTYTYKTKTSEIKYTAYFYTVKYIAPRLNYSIETGSGQKLDGGLLGANTKTFTFGSSGYDNYYSNEYQLRNAWDQAKKNMLAETERTHFASGIATVAAVSKNYCMQRWGEVFSIRYVDEKKGKTEYEDLRQARDYFLQGMNYAYSDKVEMINKYIQPDYSAKMESFNKAIVIWEKALEEADFKNRKARIDKKVGRNVYYNLVLANIMTNNFDKAQEYMQGRKDEETKGFLKNFLAGIESLSAFLDDQKARVKANEWRPLLTTDSIPYVYKDPATRERERREVLLAQQARDKAVKDSITALNKKTDSKQQKGKGQKKSSTPAKKVTTALAKKP